MSNILLPAMGVTAGYCVGHALAASAKLADKRQQYIVNWNRLLDNNPWLRQEFNKRFTFSTLFHGVAFGSLCGALKAARISHHHLQVALSLTSMFAIGAIYWITRNSEKNSSKQLVLTLSQEEVVAGVSLGILIGLGVSYLQR